MDEMSCYAALEEQQENEDGSAIRLAFFTFGLIAGFMIGWAWGLG